MKVHKVLINGQEPEEALFSGTVTGMTIKDGVANIHRKEPMAKTEPKQRAPKSRSADEMRFALGNLLAGNQETGLPPHYDRPDEILRDVIDELLELRQLRADVLEFIQKQQAKLTRR